MHPIPAREGYRIWADRYDAETAVSALDERCVARLTPPLDGRALLDAGCGTGRRLPPPGAHVRAVGADLTFAMLAAGRATRPGAALVNAELRALPFRDATFDVVWCRLVLGHLPSVDAAYGELARVCRAGGRVIVTDFHPAAAHAGHTRTFRDADGRLHAIEHFIHEVADHDRAARAARLRRAEHVEMAVGPAVRPFYARADALDRYERQRGLPLVLALALDR